MVRFASVFVAGLGILSLAASPATTQLHPRCQTTTRISIVGMTQNIFSLPLTDDFPSLVLTGSERFSVVGSRQSIEIAKDDAAFSGNGTRIGVAQGPDGAQYFPGRSNLYVVNALDEAVQVELFNSASPSDGSCVSSDKVARGDFYKAGILPANWAIHILTQSYGMMWLRLDIPGNRPRDVYAFYVVDGLARKAGVNESLNLNEFIRQQRSGEGVRR
jgi:hypothetical protein